MFESFYLFCCVFVHPVHDMIAYLKTTVRNKCCIHPLLCYSGFVHFYVVFVFFCGHHLLRFCAKPESLRGGLSVIIVQRPLALVNLIIMIIVNIKKNILTDNCPPATLILHLRLINSPSESLSLPVGMTYMI